MTERPFKTVDIGASKPGAVEVVGCDVYLDGDEIIVTGIPLNDEAFEGGGHNCDWMGCSSVSHVIIRGRVERS